MATKKTTATKAEKQATAETPTVRPQAVEPEKAVSVDVDALLAQNDALLEQMRLLAERNQQLAAALTDARRAPVLEAVAEEEKQLEVVNVAGCSVTFFVTDHRGARKDVFLAGRGSRYKLTPEQVEELRERDREIFEGPSPLLALVGAEEANPNVILDVKRFCRTLPLERISERVQQIENVPLLYDLYHHIESQRFVSEDALGQPLTREEGGVQVPALKEVALDPRLSLLETAVIRRMQELTGVRLSADGGE